MSDLSRLLDDVYGDPGTSSALDPTAPATDDTDLGDLADWGAGAASDDPFAAWASDPASFGSDASDTPTEQLAAITAPVDLPAPSPGRSFFTELAGTPSAAPADESTPLRGGWNRSDDDILPSGRVKAGRTRRRKAAAVAEPVAVPTIESFAAEVPGESEEPAAVGKKRFGRRKG